MSEARRLVSNVKRRSQFTNPSAGAPLRLEDFIRGVFELAQRSPDKKIHVKIKRFTPNGVPANYKINMFGDIKKNQNSLNPRPVLRQLDLRDVLEKGVSSRFVDYFCHGFSCPIPTFYALINDYNRRTSL